VTHAAVEVGVSVETRARRHIDLAADDGLDPGGGAGLVELDGPVHRTVVGDRKGGHLQVGSAGHELLDAAGAVEEAVFRVYV